jgi:hypothetical protein
LKLERRNPLVISSQQSKEMSKKYAFPSLKDVRREVIADLAKVDAKKGTAASSRPSKVKRRDESEESSEDDASSSESSVSEPERDENRAQRGARYEPELEEAEDDMEAQLEQEDGGSQRRKRLPELDFVLSFAHKRARDLLRTSDDDDTALVTVVATWLRELEDRFETFEKQAAKFDEYESALLQSQRMHQKIRKQIAVLLKQESEIGRSLDQTRTQNERRKLGTREAQKAQQLLNSLKT